MDMFITMVVEASWMYAYDQINQTVYIKYVQYFFAYQLYSNKMVKKEQEKYVKMCKNIHIGWFFFAEFYKSEN